MVHAQRFNVEDENDLAPENVPETCESTALKEGRKWKKNGVCYHKQINGFKMKANLTYGDAVRHLGLHALFKILFP